MHNIYIYYIHIYSLTMKTNPKMVLNDLKVTTPPKKGVKPQ